MESGMQIAFVTVTVEADHRIFANLTTPTSAPQRAPPSNRRWGSSIQIRYAAAAAVVFSGHPRGESPASGDEIVR